MVRFLPHDELQRRVTDTDPLRVKMTMGHGDVVVEASVGSHHRSVQVHAWKHRLTESPCIALAILGYRGALRFECPFTIVSFFILRG